MRTNNSFLSKILNLEHKKIFWEKKLLYMMMDFLKIQKLYFVNSKCLTLTEIVTYLAGNHAFLVQKLQFKFFQLMLCQKTKIRLTNLKYINNIFSIQVMAPHVPHPSCRMKWKEYSRAYNSQYSRTPFYIKRAILNVLRHVFHIAKYFLNI